MVSYFSSNFLWLQGATYYALSEQLIYCCHFYWGLHHDQLQAGNTAWYDAGAGHATWGYAWHPWHAGIK